MPGAPELIVYIDVKSPYAYLAIEPTRALAAELGVEPDWRTYTLQIPEFLGAVETRNPHQWRRVRYSYMDARRMANRRGLILRGPEKIYDTSLAHIAMALAGDHGRMHPFLDRLSELFWRRDIDIEDGDALAGVLDEVGGPGGDLAAFAAGEGRRRHDAMQAEAEELGVFGVPSYIVGGELFWGGDRLDMVRECLEGVRGTVIELWIPVTIFAAFCQNLRSAVQKHLKGTLSDTGATFSRFGYGFPVALAYVLALRHGWDMPWPEPGGAFLLYGAIGGLAQIAATFLLVYLFSFRNFAVGTTFSKTETVQAAVFGAVILGDGVGLSGAAAILVSLVGVVLLAAARETLDRAALLAAWTERTALIGILSGSFFGISAVSYRAASLSLDGPGFAMQAGFTLACVTLFQTVAMALYMAWREREQLGAVLRAWRWAGLAGVAGALGSIGWFTAMTIQNVAYVRALGQIELVFTFVAGALVFKERTNRVEVAGILLVVAGILVLILG